MITWSSTNRATRTILNLRRVKRLPQLRPPKPPQSPRSQKRLKRLLKAVSRRALNYRRQSQPARPLLTRLPRCGQSQTQPCSKWIWRSGRTSSRKPLNPAVSTVSGRPSIIKANNENNRPSCRRTNSSNSNRSNSRKSSRLRISLPSLSLKYRKLPLLRILYLNRPLHK